MTMQIEKNALQTSAVHGMSTGTDGQAVPVASFAGVMNGLRGLIPGKRVPEARQGGQYLLDAAGDMLDSIEPPISDSGIRSLRTSVQQNATSDVAGAVGQLMADRDILAVGEIHDDRSSLRQLAPALLEAAHAGGATRLFLELPWQSHLNRYLRSGNPNWLPVNLAEPGYRALLDKARSLGMEVVAADFRGPATDEKPDNRNNGIAAAVIRHMQPGDKAVLWLEQDLLLQKELPRSVQAHPVRSVVSQLAGNDLATALVLGMSSNDAARWDAPVGHLLREPGPPNRGAIAVDPSLLPTSVRQLDVERGNRADGIGSPPYVRPVGQADLWIVD